MKIKRCRKMLTKAEKKRIVDYVKSLNAMAAAALSLTEAVYRIPKHETELKGSLRESYMYHLKWLSL